MSSAVSHKRYNPTLLQYCAYFLEAPHEDFHDPPAPSSPPPTQTVSEGSSEDQNDSDDSSTACSPCGKRRPELCSAHTSLKVKLGHTADVQQREERCPVSRKLSSGFTASVGNTHLPKIHCRDLLGTGRIAQGIGLLRRSVRIINRTSESCDGLRGP